MRPVRPGRNVSYSVEYGFAWLRVAKVGTRSLNGLLRDEVMDYVYLTRRDPVPPEGLSLLSGQGYRFAIVRNPWDRLFSAWAQKIRGRSLDDRRVTRLGRSAEPSAVAPALTDFPSFVRLLEASTLFEHDIHFQPQAQILQSIELDFVGRFERYVESVRHALEVVGLGQLTTSLGHRNRTSDGSHYSTRYDEETRDTVARLYAADIERWGYEFEHAPMGDV